MNSTTCKITSEQLTARADGKVYSAKASLLGFIPGKLPAVVYVKFGARIVRFTRICAMYRGGILEAIGYSASLAGSFVGLNIFNN